MRYKKTIKTLATLALLGSTALLSAAETTDSQTSQRPQFSKVDLNGDNLISKAELTAHAKTQFDRTDTNADAN